MTNFDKKTSLTCERGSVILLSPVDDTLNPSPCRFGAPMSVELYYNEYFAKLNEFYSDAESESNGETDMGGFPIAGPIVTPDGTVVGSWGPTSGENWFVAPDGVKYIWVV